MHYQFAFKHMEVSEPLKDYAEGKVSEKVAKFVNKPIEAKITFSVDKHVHKAHCSLHGGDGFNVEVEHASADMYGSVDKMTDKLVAQLKKQKEKLKDHRNTSFAKNLAPDVHEQDPDEMPMDAEDVIKLEANRQRD